jgi:hypothetical protein
MYVLFKYPFGMFSFALGILSKKCSCLDKKKLFKIFFAPRLYNLEGEARINDLKTLIMIS